MKEGRLKNGFTLIELLVAISIMVILASLALAQLDFFQNKNRLDSAAQEILAALRLAQNKTLASEGASSFGVHFETDKYVIFRGAAYSAAASDNDVHLLDQTVNISQITLNGLSANAVFERLTGDTQNYGSVRLETKNDSSNYRTIHIQQSGIFGLSQNTADDAARVSDSRHVNVAYSQNAKFAATLALNFPADGVTQNISFQNFLNPDKTEFSWEGTASVGGASQKIKIHTHVLSDSSAVFCVHRDRQYNNKQLSVSLDGQNLINYSAAGTVTQGSSAWAGQPQIQ